MAIDVQIKELNALCSPEFRYFLVKEGSKQVLVLEKGLFSATRIQSVAVASSDEEVLAAWLSAEILNLKKKKK